MVKISAQIRSILPILLITFTLNNAIGETHTDMTLDFRGYSIHITKIETKPSGKSVVNLHGMCMYGDYYKALIEFLPEDFAKFYFIDMPNHGRSSGERGFLPDEKTILDIIDFTISAIKEKDKLAQIDLIAGESMGGIFALYYLLNRDSEANDKYLIFGAPLYLKYEFIFDPKLAKYLHFLLFSKEELVVPVIDYYPSLIKDPYICKQMLFDSLIPKYVNFNYLLTINKMSEKVNSNFGKISKKVLFFYGEQDSISNVKKIVKRNEAWKNVQTIVLPKLPHSIFWTDKDFFKAQIEDWLLKPAEKLRAQ